AAREEKGLTLEDVAAQTRIPRRHLESIETADWDKLPAPTYTIGFARNYASVVGLDRAEIADQLRGEMGGHRPATTTEVFEPADPARTMPKGLVIGAIVAVLAIVLLMSWLSRRSLESSDEPTTNVPSAATPAQPTTPPTPAAPAQQTVVLTATSPAWVQVRDQDQTLFEGELQAGQSYSVPPNLVAPMLKAGKPEALRVMVGSTAAPPIGPPGKVTTVSLKPSDLIRQPAAPGAGAPAVPAPTPATRSEKPARRPQPPAPAPTEPQPQTNTGE
ncbi:MAG TPA: helix-turn-helix domain-containing protein, partial [Sphingomicrobium sp.]